MNNFSKNFKTFLSSFNNKEKGILESVISLNRCFQLDSKFTFHKLYQKQILFRKEFLELRLDSTDIPTTYKLLVQIIKQNGEDICNHEKFIFGLSKSQILQGVANVLEKKNAELKYNENWNRKYANGDSRYLETERQSMYFSSAGISFQELLKRYYTNAPDNDEKTVLWDANIEASFADILEALMRHVEIKDTVERHLFFDWNLEDSVENTLRTTPPANQKEGTTENDIYHHLKSKFITEAVTQLANQNSTKRYLEMMQGKIENPYSHLANTINEDDFNDASGFAESLALYTGADLTVEMELALCTEKHFPGLDNAIELELCDKTKMPLRETFLITAFICELSKKHINDADKQYNNGVNHFAAINPTSDAANEIETMVTLLKGNREAIKDLINKNNSNELFNEQEKLIIGAKNLIANENCMVRFDLEKLVETIHKSNGVDKDFIKKVLDIFTYNSSISDNVTRAPFFKIGDNLCWMPNMVAYASFAENLIENLLIKDLISIHRLQTDFYETSLKSLFKRYGYDVIIQDKDKIIKGDDGKDLGDFDLLAHKNSEIILLQLKLTSTRNSYFERWYWKSKALENAKIQIETCIKFIHEKPEHIRKILGLSADAKINRIAPFILSNSTIYDHERIGNYLKIWYFELRTALIMVEKKFPDDPKNLERLVNLLNSGKLFQKLKAELVTIEGKRKYGDYCIVSPTIKAQNIHTSV